MAISEYIPLENITVSGTFPGTFYPIWINDWGQAAVNTNYSLTLEGWLLEGGDATGPIIANYVENDYIDDPNFDYFLARKSYVDAQVSLKADELSSYLSKAGGILESPIKLSDTTNVPDDAAVTVGYVDDIANLYLRTEMIDGSEQQMTGAITLHSTINEAYGELDAIPAKYVIDSISSIVSQASSVIGLDYVPLSGGTVKGHITVPDPVNDCHAATLKYVKEYLAQKTKEYFDAKIAALEKAAQ